MGVRVRVRIRYSNKEVETVALANSGYESIEPEIHIPLAVAKRLGMSLETATMERYSVVGSEVAAFSLGYVYVRAETGDKVTEWVKAKAVCVPNEYEVIMSDALIEALGIEIVRAKQGLWRFHGEERVRESEKPFYWLT